MTDPLVLINAFEVPREDAGQFIAAWERTRDYLASQPGYVDTALHQAVTPNADFQFVNIGRWQTAEDFHKFDSVDLSACNYTTAEFFEHLRAGDRAPRAGDLLFIRNVSVGLVSVVAPDLPEFAMGQETVLLRRKSDVHPAFLRYALVGAEARHAIEGAMIGSTFRRINVSAIRSLPVPTPLIDEQRRIAA